MSSISLDSDKLKVMCHRKVSNIKKYRLGRWDRFIANKRRSIWHRIFRRSWSEGQTKVHFIGKLDDLNLLQWHAEEVANGLLLLCNQSKTVTVSLSDLKSISPWEQMNEVLSWES